MENFQIWDPYNNSNGSTSLNFLGTISNLKSLFYCCSTGNSIKEAKEALYIEYYSLSLLFLNCHLFKDNSTCQDYTGVQLTPLHGLDLVLLDFFLVSQGQILVLYKKVYMVKKLIHNSCKLTYIWNTSLAYLAFHGFHIYFNNCSLRV